MGISFIDVSSLYILVKHLRKFKLFYLFWLFHGISDPNATGSSNRGTGGIRKGRLRTSGMYARMIIYTVWAFRRLDYHRSDPKSFRELFNFKNDTGSPKSIYGDLSMPEET